MASAARVNDLTNHPGQIAGPGVTSVLIGGFAAAVLKDVHVCMLPPQAGPHPTNNIIKGSGSVFIGGRPAARQGDLTGCGASIVTGMSSVQIGD